MLPSAMDTELQLMTGSASDITQARRYQFISWAEQELAYRLRTPEVQSFGTVPLVEDYDYYLYPSDLFAIYSVSYPALGRGLTKADITDFDKIDTKPDGPPSQYARYGKTLYIDSIPTSDEDGNVLRLRYAKFLDEVGTTSTAFTLPTQYHEMILLGALYRVMRARREFEQMGVIQQELFRMAKSLLGQLDEEQRWADPFPMEAMI